MDLLQGFFLVWLGVAAVVTGTADWYLGRPGKNPLHMEVIEVALDAIKYTGTGLFLGFSLVAMDMVGRLL